MIPHKFIPLLFSYFGKNDGQVINKISKYLDRGIVIVLLCKFFLLLALWKGSSQVIKYISKYTDRGRANVLPYKLFLHNFWHFGKDERKDMN